MDASELLKKENVYKALALVLVAGMVLSSLAIGLLGKADSGDQGTTSVYIEGDAITNATLLSYRPYIIAENLNESGAELMKGLAEVDEVTLTSQGYVISVKDSSLVSKVYSQLKAINASGKANAIISLPSGIELQTANGTEIVAGGEIKARIEPVFEEGEQLSVKIYLQAQDGQIVAYGMPAILPTEQVFERNASVVALAAVKTNVIVPWELRYEVIGDVENATAKYGQDAVSYIKKDYILANAGGTKPDYVTFVLADTVFVGNFTDMQQVSADFKNATFPDSIIKIGANATEFGGFQKTYEYAYNVMISENGKQDYIILESKKFYAENETVPVVVTAYAFKDRIVSIVSAVEKDE